MMEAGDADKNTKYKVRIHAMATVYVRRALPKPEVQTLPSGIQVQAQNWYDEHECQQLAVNFNALYMTESQLAKLLMELCGGIRQSMIDKGLIIP